MHRRHLIWPVLAVAAAVDLRSLARNDVQTVYYEAAVKSMAHSWNAFVFAALDPGRYITVDKPPGGFWPEAILAHLFGLNRWTIGLPQVVEGVLTVFVLWLVVSRAFGELAGLVAAFTLTVTPIAVAASHDNIPDPLLALLVVSAAWATMRGAEDGRLRWFVLAGAFVGLGFQTKTIAAFLPLPAFVIGYLIATRAPWRRRAVCLGVGAVSIVLCSLPWVLAVALTPAHDRPWIGGTTRNTAFDLATSRTGFDRFGPIGINGFRPLGFGGTPRFTRLFNSELAGQDGWFVLAAAACALLAGWAAWRGRDRRRLGGVVLFAVWGVLLAGVFSYATGIFHAYYLLGLAPALAALVGAGGAAALELLHGRAARIVVALALVVATLGELKVLSRTPQYLDWLKPLVIGLTVLAALGLVAGLRLALAVAGAALLVAPAAWAVGASGQRQFGPIPMAGPLRPDTRTSYVAVSPPGLASFLLGRRRGERWDLATTDAIGAAPLILDGVRVAALGGFLGVDPAGTPASVAKLLAERKLRFVLTTDPAFGYYSGQTEAYKVVEAVRSECRQAQPGAGLPPPLGTPSFGFVSWQQTLYDCKGVRLR